MPEIRYLDFDLLIARSEAGYSARVLESPVGQALGEFALPFSDLELENLLLRVGRPRPGVHGVKSPEAEAAREFGGRLFQAVFDDGVRACLRRSLNEAERWEAGLRIRLRLTDAPELAHLPWEFLYDPALRRFFALSAETPIVRYLDMPERIRPLAVKPPLKVLVMIASPHDYPQFNAEREWASLTEALSDLTQRRLVALERLQEATLPALQRHLLQAECHVLHYIGHGDFNERAGDGVLLLEDEHRWGRRVRGEDLASLLRDHRPLRLAILNACEGARASRSDPFAGVAQSLVQQGGVPAVIAMQFEVTDQAAITFAHWFYTAVADGRPVDAALAEARKAINNQWYGVEWGTPVLYMRAPDGRIFDVELEEYVRGIEEEEAEGPAPIPTPRPPDVFPGNLPASLTTFIGREGEMAAVKQWLSTARLLTLTGPGGCGKTRLALEAARSLVEEYADGVWWVELTSLDDPALVPQEVARVLGVREEPGRALSETLADQLRPRQLLLVLDNCEHLVKACAVLADTLLRACPNLRVLATSREALNISGEVVWGVPPLSLPEGRERVPPFKELSKYEAVRLFTERARQRRRGFELTPQNALGVVQICRRLDGLPLAIEMAAARVRALSVGQIAMRLDDRFWLLTRGRRTRLPHHQTLRAAVDWSYNLLTEAERALFNRLSVFAGGFALEAAEAVGAGDGLEAYAVLGLVTRLVDKSLVAVEEVADGKMRYRLLETLRQYGRERLAASGEVEDTRCRHAAYFLALAEASEPALEGPEQAMWLDRLEVEHDNLRAALRWARESEDADTGLRLAGALWPFWAVRGYWGEGWEWLTGLLALPGAAERTAVRATALNGAGAMAYYRGDYTTVRSLWEESLAIRRELGDTAGIARSLNNLGAVAREEGDYDTARALWEESLAIKRELGDKPGIAVSFCNLGDLAREQGDLAAARSRWEESLKTWRALGDKQNIAGMLRRLGDLAYDLGDYNTARPLLEESLGMWRELGHTRGIAASLKSLGDVARSQGDHATARSLWEESLAIARELEDRRGVAELLAQFAGLAAAEHQPERAMRLAGAAAALRETVDTPFLPVEEAECERDLEPARQALGEEAAARVLAEGRAMTMEQAIEYALADAHQVCGAGREGEDHARDELPQL